MDGETRGTVAFLGVLASVGLAPLLVAGPIEAKETPVEPKTVSEIYEAMPKREIEKVAVTAYTSRPEETDDSPCISADGSDICELYDEGKLTCATNDHAMGTWLHVPGYGDCVVRDRMNRRYTGSGRVDVYMGQDLAEARAWGLKELAVTELGD